MPCMNDHKRMCLYGTSYFIVLVHYPPYPSASDPITDCYHSSQNRIEKDFKTSILLLNPLLHIHPLIFIITLLSIETVPLVK